MDLNVMQKQLIDGLRQLELRVAAQEGALALLDKLMQPEIEEVELEEVPEVDDG